MTHLEIGLSVIQIVQFGAIYWLTKYNRDLLVEQEKLRDFYAGCAEIKEKMIVEANKKVLELEKKAKISTDVIEVLHDMKNGGVMLHVERIDKNDIFFHNGGQYR